jgi:hypothetical protein
VAILTVLSYGTVAALIAGLVACGFRRWGLATSLSRAVVLSGLAILLVNVAVSIVFPLRASGPSARAIALSQGISEVMNVGGVAFAAGLLGVPLWGIARWRVREAGRRAGH